MLAVANDKGKITILQIASLFKNDDGKTRLTLTVIILILYCYISEYVRLNLHVHRIKVYCNS